MKSAHIVGCPYSLDTGEKYVENTFLFTFVFIQITSLICFLSFAMPILMR